MYASKYIHVLLYTLYKESDTHVLATCKVLSCTILIIILITVYVVNNSDEVNDLTPNSGA